MQPIHQYASVTLGVTASLAHDRLRQDVAGIVETATAEAITGMAPFVRAWGLVPTRLPNVTARETAGDELGSVEVSWTGAEDAIAWPALVGRLSLAPRPGGGSRVSLFSTRSPEAELRTDRIGSLHRRRVVDVGVQRFLHHLVAQLDDPGAGPAHPGAGATAFDRTPLYLHHLCRVDHDPAAVLATLTEAPEQLAATITGQVVRAAREPLAAGRFRRQPEPYVHAQVLGPNHPGVLRVSWSSNEEDTGWPRLQLTIGVEAAEPGARILVLADRESGYDLSRNRVDKAQRHQILRGVGTHVAEAVELALPGVVGPSEAAPHVGGRRVAAVAS